MTDRPHPRFRGGPNIAMKVPRPQWEATVAFYRDTLGLEVLGEHEDSVRFRFGACCLWIDRVPTASHAELWLEVTTPDPEAALEWLDTRGIVRRDEIEPLPRGFRGGWIAAPSSIIHLVTSPAESSGSTSSDIGEEPTP